MAKSLPIMLFVLFAMVTTLPALLGQKKVMGKPLAFSNPIDMPGLENSLGNEMKDVWIVISDRDGNQTYSGPNVAENHATLKFRDWFYVTEVRNGEWLHLCKAKLEGKDGKKISNGTYIDFGWIQKSKMLLWTNSLIDPNSKIHKKAFILNKVTDIIRVIESPDPKIVDIYYSPVTEKKPDEHKTIYEFYFIYKKESGRYLIGKDDEFSTITLSSTLVGWVEERWVAPWNTRLALEPNFTEEGFQERKTNENFYVSAYDNEDYATQHASTGKRNTSRIFWSNDPVSLSNKDLADNSNRYKGEVVRFPLLNCKGDFYRSGIVGEISFKTAGNTLEKMDEVYYSQLINLFNKKKIGLSNFDILFVIEGTKNMGEYRTAIIESINKIRKEFVNVDVIRFGVCIYRDVIEEEYGKLYTTKKMTQNVDEIIDFLTEAEFARWKDNDPWTAMNYGIRQSLRECGMNSNHTNIVVVIGNCADYSYYGPRRQKDKTHSATIKDNEIIKDLADFNVHLIGIQTQDLGNLASTKYQEQIRNLIMQSAITQHQVFKNVGIYSKPGQNLGNPIMPELSEGSELYLQNGSAFGLLKKPSSGASLPPSEVVSTLVSASSKIYSRVEDMWENLRLILEEGASYKDINAGDFAGPMLDMVADLIADGEFSKEDLEKLFNSKKYKLYAEVFTPRKISGAKYDAYSLVLFMPENDLSNYVGALNKLKLGFNKPVDEQRELLYETFVELASQFSGNRKSPENLSVDELRHLMQGINLEACSLPKRWGNIRISDIQNRKKMSDEEVKKRIEEIVNNTRELQTIINRGKNYEFCYSTSNETYYWIPIEYTF